MKVIERAYRPQVGRMSCKCCGSILEFTENDVQASAQYNQVEYYITCPVCGTANPIVYNNFFGWKVDLVP